MVKAIPGSVERDRKRITWLLGTTDDTPRVLPAPIGAHWLWLGPATEVTYQSLWNGGNWSTAWLVLRGCVPEPPPAQWGSAHLEAAAQKRSLRGHPLSWAMRGSWQIPVISVLKPSASDKPPPGSLAPASTQWEGGFSRFPPGPALVLALPPPSPPLFPPPGKRKQRSPIIKPFAPGHLWPQVSSVAVERFRTVSLPSAKVRGARFVKRSRDEQPERAP